MMASSSNHQERHGILLPTSSRDKKNLSAESKAPRAQDTTEPLAQKEAWWNVHPFQGMINDVRRRGPFYVSDWLDAWDYRVVPATVYMYFAK